MSLLDAITEYIKYGEYASSEIVKAIEEIKQNEKITPLGGKCFTVKLSDIDRTILSAEYYDFETQKTTLLEIVNNRSDIIGKIKVLSDIAQTGKYRKGENTILFHPKVCEAVKKIVDEVEGIL